MNTSAIRNPIVAVPAQTPKTQQAGANAADSPFNQILSREVADRHGANDAADASKASPKEAAGANPPNPASAAPAKEKTADKDASEATETAPASALNAADAASVQILALAMQFALAGATPSAAPASDDAVPTDAASGRAGGIGKDDATSALWMPELTDDQSAASKGKDALPTGSGFDTLMDEARDPKQLMEAVQLKTQETQSATSAAALAMAPVQAAVVDKAHMAAGHPMEKLTPQVGTPGWDQALGQKVVWMVAGAQQSASLTLNPPDLGPLQVVLNVTNSQATANFYSTQPEVRQALEAALPKLREMLGDAGIQLGQADVSAGAPHQNRHGASGEQRQGSARSGGQGIGTLDTPAPVSHGVLPAGRLGMVDTFA